MKKFIVMLFASLLVLSACGDKEEESSSKDSAKETKDVKKDKKETKKDDKTKKEKESAKKSEPKTEEVTSNEPQTAQEVNSTEQTTQEQQTVEQPVQQPQQNEESNQYHYDPEYDRYGYTGMVDETGMPELDPNENYDPHGGQVPNDNLTEEEIRDMMD